MGWQGCVPFDILADCSAILCHRMQHPQGSEKKGGKKQRNSVWGNPRWLVIFQGDICCSREIQQIRCVTDASGSQKNLPSRDTWADRSEAEMTLMSGSGIKDGTLGSLISVMIFLPS